MDDDHTLPECFDIFYHDECDQVYLKNLADGAGAAGGENKSSSKLKYGYFLGRSYAHSYHINNMMVPKKCENGIRLTVQSVDFTGKRNIPEEDAFVELMW